MKISIEFRIVPFTILLTLGAPAAQGRSDEKINDKLKDPWIAAVKKSFE
jgi:hypothetical protein